MASPLDSLESPQTVRSMGTDSLPSPYDSTTLYTNTFSHLHNLDSSMIGKQPPSYEEGTLQTLHALGIDPSFNGFGLPFRDIAHQVKCLSHTSDRFIRKKNFIFHFAMILASSTADVTTCSDSGISHTFASVQQPSIAWVSANSFSPRASDSVSGFAAEPEPSNFIVHGFTFSCKSETISSYKSDSHSSHENRNSY